MAATASRYPPPIRPPTPTRRWAGRPLPRHPAPIAFAPCVSPRSYSGLAYFFLYFHGPPPDPPSFPTPPPSDFTPPPDTTPPDTTITAAPPARSTSSSASFS